MQKHRHSQRFALLLAATLAISSSPLNAQNVSVNHTAIDAEVSLASQLNIANKLLLDGFINDISEYTETFKTSSQTNLEAVASAEVALETVKVTLKITNTSSFPLEWTLSHNLQSSKFLTSDDEGGPVFDWIDISQNQGVNEVTWQLTGTEDDGITLVNEGDFDGAGDEGRLNARDTGFNFSFLGETFNQFFIYTNGYITFTGDASQNATKAPAFPQTIHPANIIAPFWANVGPLLDERTLQLLGHVYYQKLPNENTLVVQYQDVDTKGSDAEFTFQIILKDDGTIISQYKKATLNFNTSTQPLAYAVGFQKDKLNAKAQGLTVSQDDQSDLIRLSELDETDADPTNDGLAVQMFPVLEWLSFQDPDDQSTQRALSKTTEGNTSVDIPIFMNAGDLTEGIYTATIRLASTTNGTPNSTIEIPVTLTVFEESAGDTVLKVAETTQETTVEETDTRRTYIQWLGDHGLNPTLDLNKDSDGDTMHNLLEYALGHDPNTVDDAADPAILPQPTLVSDGSNKFLTFDFTTAIVKNITIFVEVSNDLKVWESGNTSLSGLPATIILDQPRDLTSGTQHYRIRDFLSQKNAPGKRFMRLKIRNNPNQ